MGSRNL